MGNSDWIWIFAGGLMIVVAGTLIYLMNRRIILAPAMLGTLVDRLGKASWSTRLLLLAGFFTLHWLAMASLGKWAIALMLAAMLAVMTAAPNLHRRIFGHLVHRPSRSKMEIRQLTPTYAVSPQIEPADLTAIRAAGFTTVIDNRPDDEIDDHLHATVMQAAAEALGLTFVNNPVIGGALTMDNVQIQAEAAQAASGPVFAYCASGNRCSIVWALMNAGTRPTDELIKTALNHGYHLEHLRAKLDALAADAGPAKG